MNQDKPFSLTIIDLSNEYRILIEEINDFDTSFFKDVYKQALNHVKEIVETNDSYREKIEDENNHSIIDGLPDAYNNIIVFEGDRGKGKSSAMLSFRKALVNKDNRNSFFEKGDLANNYNFVSFDVIDPSFFNGDETLFEIIVAKLFHQFEQKLQNSGSNIMDDKRRELISSFQQVFEDIKNQNNKSNVYNGDALDALIKLSTSSNLRKSFSKLLRLYLDVFGAKNKSNYLVLTIDDFDLNIPGMYQMMEDIRRFLINEKIIILMSCKFSQVQEATYLEFYNILFSKINNIQVLDNIIPKEEIVQKGNKHIQKLIPSNRVNKLRDLAIDYYDFEVNEASRFLKSFSFILSDSNNQRERIKQELNSLRILSLNDVERLEDKYSSSLIIGENFQRTFFKYFYKINHLFICNRKNYIYGLVPHTFRDLYDIKKQINDENFEDYIKDLLLNRINTKRIELKEDTLNDDRSFLLFYDFLYRSINFIDANDLVLFNNYFISNIKTLNNIFRPTNGMRIEFLQDNIYIKNSIPNSWIYSILYGIKNNNQQLDQDLEQVLDLYILFYFLKNKTYSSLYKDKNKLFSPTNAFYFTVQKTKPYKKSNIKNFGYYEVKDHHLLETNEFQKNIYVKVFFSYLVSDIVMEHRGNGVIPYKIVDFGTEKDLSLPPSFNLELTRIFQPDFEIYQKTSRKYRDDILNSNSFTEWFNPTQKLTKKYVDLFYNPIFFELFTTKLQKNIEYDLIIFNSDLVISNYFHKSLNKTLNQINEIYPYLELSFKEIIITNPLLSLYYNSKEKGSIEKVFKSFYNSIEDILEIDQNQLKENQNKKRILSNYLKAWPGKSNTERVVKTLESKLASYLQNSLCTNEQKSIINPVLLFIRQEIIDRNLRDVKISDGLIDRLNKDVKLILNSLQNG